MKSFENNEPEQNAMHIKNCMTGEDRSDVDRKRNECKGKRNSLEYLCEEIYKEKRKIGRVREQEWQTEKNEDEMQNY